MYPTPARELYYKISRFDFTEKYPFHVLEHGTALNSKTHECN